MQILHLPATTAAPNTQIIIPYHLCYLFLIMKIFKWMCLASKCDTTWGAVEVILLNLLVPEPLNDFKVRRDCFPKCVGTAFSRL